MHSGIEICCPVPYQDLPQEPESQASGGTESSRYPALRTCNTLSMGLITPVATHSLGVHTRG